MKKLLPFMLLAVSLLMLASCMPIIDDSQAKPAIWEFKVVSVTDKTSYEKQGAYGPITVNAPTGKVFKEIVVTAKNTSEEEQYLGGVDSILLYTRKGAASIGEELALDIMSFYYCHLGSGESANVTFRFAVTEGTKLTTGAYIKWSPFLVDSGIEFPVSE